MNTIWIILISLIVLLIFIYAYLKLKDNSIDINSIYTFGEDPGAFDFEQNIIKQKLIHRNISFYAYIATLSVSFLIGSFALYKIIATQIDWKFLKDVLGLAAGTIATISFKNLYTKCTNEINFYRRRKK